MFNFINNRTTARQSINRLIEKSKNDHKAFTLVELMLVMAIMGLMATISVGGYRAMRQGMEESGVTQNVRKFLTVANQRAKIDGLPVAVVFWNETRQTEDAKDPDKTLLVVGRAAAIRQAGRVSRESGSYVIDEFGDLRHFQKRTSKGVVQKNYFDEIGTRIYKMKGNNITYSRVSQYAQLLENTEDMLMMSDPAWNTDEGLKGAEDKDREVKVYGYEILDGNAGTWKAGEAYGLEFATLTLPNNYIFGSGSQFTQSSVARTDLGDVMFFNRSDAFGSITISALRPNENGELVPNAIGSSIKASDIENEDK